MTDTVEQTLFDGFANRDATLLRQSVREIIETRLYKCILHPLGFYFIRLAERGKTTIRLHYWPAGHREKGTAITPYHDHVWELCSCVLAGSLENVLIQLEPDNSGDFQVAHINQIGNVDEVVLASTRVRMSIQSRQRYRAGEFYEIEPRVFHYTDVPEETPVLTVVQSTIVIEGGPRTLMPVGASGHMPSREPVSGSEQILLEIDHLLGIPFGTKNT